MSGTVRPTPKSLSESTEISINDNGAGVNVWLYATEGCVLEPGIHQFATLVYQIVEFAEFGQDIALTLGDVSIMDAYGNGLYIILENGVITLQLLGDVNRDGARNVLDIVHLVNFILQINEPDDYQLWAGDMNGDVMLDVLDIVLLVNVILSGDGN